MNDALPYWIGFGAVILGYIIFLIYCAKSKTIKLTTGWLWFYTYIRMPLGIIFTLSSVLRTDWSILSSMLPTKYQIIVPLAWLIGLGVIVLLIFNIVGLSGRKSWGYNLNWWVLIGECLLFPFSQEITFYKPTDFSGYLVLVGIVTFLWFLPNAIYFTKRRHLFISEDKTEKESIKKENIEDDVKDDIEELIS